MPTAMLVVMAAVLVGGLGLMGDVVLVGAVPASTGALLSMTPGACTLTASPGDSVRAMRR